MKALSIFNVSLFCFAGAAFAQSAIVSVGGDAQSNNDCGVGNVKKNAAYSVRSLRD